MPDPPLTSGRSKRHTGDGYLNFLTYLSYSFAGAQAVITGLIVWYFLAGNAQIDPQFLKNAWDIYVVSWPLRALVTVVLNVLSGYYLSARRNRAFSLIVAGWNCLQVPWWTVFGVFTLLVLSRKFVCQVYEEDGQSGDFLPG